MTETRVETVYRSGATFPKSPIWGGSKSTTCSSSTETLPKKYFRNIRRSEKFPRRWFSFSLRRRKTRPGIEPGTSVLRLTKRTGQDFRSIVSPQRKKELKLGALKSSSGFNLQNDHKSHRSSCRNDNKSVHLHFVFYGHRIKNEINLLKGLEMRF